MIKNNYIIKKLQMYKNSDKFINKKKNKYNYRNNSYINN